MKRELGRPNEEEKKLIKEDSQNSSQLADQPLELNFVPKIKRKEAIMITYRGLIESGDININHALTVLYSAVCSENWKLSQGQKSGISQKASHNGSQIVWNFPFEMTFETSQPSGWPQLVLIIYGKDYFGRSVAKGYGNLHFPVSPGNHTRKIKIFETISPSTTATCCAFIMGYINELKQPEKVLLQEGREYLQTKLIGQVTLKIQVRRYNFENQGYD